MIDSRILPVKLASGELIEITLELETLESGKRALKCRHRNFSFFAEEFDYFAAMQKLRIMLEKKGAQLLCHGSRIDVWPSGMSRDMGGGILGYVCKMGEPAKEMVNIFTPDINISYASVREQTAHFEKWWESVRGRSDLGWRLFHLVKKSIVRLWSMFAR